MAAYKYKARDRGGNLRFGKIEADSKAHVRTQLRKILLVPLSIRLEQQDSVTKVPSLSLEYFYYRDKEGRIQLRLGYQWPKTRDLAVFSRQFASMLNSGVTMMKCLEILRDQQNLYDFSKAIEVVRKEVEHGKTLSDSLQLYPNIFTQLYVAMVRAGETAGQLDTIMRRLSEHLDKISKIISQTKSALYYPVSVVAMSILIIIGMLIFVVPVFAQQFQAAGQELPALTRWVVDGSNFIRERYILFLSIVVGIVISFKLALKTDQGRRLYDKAIMKIPAVGLLIYKTVVARFCYTMSAMLSGGVNMIDGLLICSMASNNKVVEENVMVIKDKVAQGENLSDSMRETSIFPNMVVAMTEVGEQTGELDSMLAKIAEIYEEEVEEQVKALLSLLEPLTIIVIGGCIGVIVVAMYLPIFDMAKAVG